jgi:hypothetical protein
MRCATSKGDYAVACISTRDDGTEHCCIFRSPDLSSAQNQLTLILDEGDMGRIYDKEGTPVDLAASGVKNATS